MKAIVLKPFSYKGKSFQVGDEISIPEKHAAKFVKLDFIETEKDIKPKQVKTKSDKGEPAPKPQTKN